MFEPRILVAFETTHGHTRRIAKRIARVLGRRGLGVVLAGADRLSGGHPVDDLAAVVLVGPVHFGRHPRKLRRFAKRNREALDRVPSAFVSVSGAAIGDDEESRTEARGYVDRFLEETGWSPDLILPVGGGVAYTEYNPVLRVIMRSISARQGLSTDTTRDHDYTDWERVESFAAEVAGLVEHGVGVREAVRDGPRA